MNTKTASARLTRHSFKYAETNTQEGVAAAAIGIKIASAVAAGHTIAEAVVAYVPPEQQIAVIDELYQAAYGGE